MKGKNGFSFIELMIVLVAIGVLASLSIPRFNAYIKTNQLSSDSYNLYLKMETYELCSIKEERCYFCFLDIKNNNINFYVDVNNNHKYDDNDKIITSFKLSDAIDIECSSNRVLNNGIKFNYKAKGFGYYSCTINLKNKVSHRLYAISLPVNNNRIRIKENFISEL